LYSSLGVKDAYQKVFSQEYVNPHESNIRLAMRKVVQSWPLDLSHVLDLAAGSGEITLALMGLGHDNVEATDPFTHGLCLRRTGKPCLTHGFEEIALGRFPPRRYSSVICSYALHLLEPSWLPQFLCGLGNLTDTLLVLSPLKRPVIRPSWGWSLDHEKCCEKVHCRLFRKKTNDQE